MKWVASQALEALVGNLVMGKLVNRDYESTFQNGGSTVTVAIPTPMTTNNMLETGTVNLQNPSVGTAQIVLDKHREASFSISNVAQILTAPDLVVMNMKESIIAIAEAIETDLLSLYPLFTYNAALGGTTALTEATVDTAETNLWAAKVPKSQKLNLVCAGSAYSSLRQISSFRDWTGIGPNVGVGTAPAMTGMLAGPTGDGHVKGFDVYRSQYVPKSGSTNYNLAFSKDAVGLVVRKLAPPIVGSGAIAEYAEMGDFAVRVVTTYNGNALAQQFTVDVLYGVAAFRQNFAQVVESN